MKRCALPAVVLLAFFLLVACERADQAVETYKKAKDLKSEFQKQSEEVQKGIADRTEDYKDRIRKKVGLPSENSVQDGDNPDRKKDRKSDDPSEDHDDRD